VRKTDADPPQSLPLAVPVVPPRSVRRSTAHRASSRRATAREHKDNVDGRILDYVKDHPNSTTGEMAKGLNVDRGAIATEVSRMMRAGEIARDPDGQIAIIHTRGDQ
jgi:predicted transcriptional regulator